MTIFPAFPRVPASRPTPGHGESLTDSQRATQRRIVLLIGAILLMGLADLLCTLTYMRSVGLPEANPLARWLAGIGSTQAIVCFKLLTMALSCFCLWLGRTQRRMELCAWTCAAILLALSIHWIGFNRAVSEHTNLLSCLADTRSPQAVAAVKAQEVWVRLED